MREVKIGRVEDYFGKVGVIAFHVEGEEIAIGDTIHIKGHTTDFQEVVDSIQIDKQPVQRAGPGSNVGIKSKEKARKGDIIYKVLLVILLVSCGNFAFLHEVEGIDFGATNINGISGNGGLTVGLSKDGDITLLKYPSPSYYDQLNYRTSNAENAHDLKFFGADENMGAFSGLIIYTASGRELSWLRDSIWEKNQHYNTDDSNILVTEYSRDDYKINVRQFDFVLPDKDVYVRHHVIHLSPGSPVVKVDLVFYENLAPCNTKVPFIPTADWNDDGLNDFGLLYYSYEDAFVHYKPETVDYSIIKSLLQPNISQNQVDIFVEELKNNEQKGIFIVIGGMSKSKEHQAGMDSSTQCKEPSISSLSFRPEDALQDIQDMTLSGSSVALCQANGAFVYPVEFNEFNYGELPLFISFGNSLKEALNNYDAARVMSIASLMSDTESYWRELLKDANLPKIGDADVIAFSKRTLLSINTSMDRDTDAIVASVSTQPPYGEDWPRDGAFINLALDVAGFTELVTQHNYFYNKVQRKEMGQDTFGMFADAPAGTFAMNYYADGVPGGPIDFEIDETGLAIWTLVQHAKFLKSNSEKCEYFGNVYPAVKLAAQALTECKDSRNNLQCYAYEDDNYILTQGLQGAVTVYLGLKSAVEVGRALKEDPSLVDLWEARANELKEAIFANFLNSEKMTFEGQEVGSRAWLIWPAWFYENGDPVAEKEADELYRYILPHLLKETDGAEYLGKITLALAMYWKDRPDKLKNLEKAILTLVREVPTVGTRHVGEVFATLDLFPEGLPDGIRDTFDARVAVPHIWEASLNYLSAMALYSPEAFAPLESSFDILPCPVNQGCGCNVTSGTTRILSTIFILIISAIGVLLLKVVFIKGMIGEASSHRYRSKKDRR